MNRKQTLIDYEKRINQVIQYIFDHLDEPLDLEKLAEVACFSPYHWHRIYRGLTGETAAQTVQRLRLQRAATELVYQQEITLGDIAERAGYASLEAFSRAFRKSYDAPPMAYRAQAAQRYPLAAPPKQERDMYPIDIRTLDSVRLLALRHTGPYMEIGKSFEQLYVWAASRDILQAGTRSIGVYYDDPTMVAPEKLRSDACLSVPADFVLDDARYHMLDLAPGRYGILHHKGPYAELEKAYGWLYGSWLPQSGEQPAEQPVIEEYLNDPRSLPPSEWLTNICIPLQS